MSRVRGQGRFVEDFSTAVNQTSIALTDDRKKRGSNNINNNKQVTIITLYTCFGRTVG